MSDAQTAKANVARIVQARPDLLRDESTLMFKLLKKAADDPDPSNLHDINEHEYLYPPFDLHMAKLMRNFNAHHSTCLETLPYAMVGQGFRNEKVEEVLDPLCVTSDGGIEGLMIALQDNYWELGAWALEVVREEPRGDAPITGIHFVPVERVRVVPNHEDPRLSGFEILPRGYGELANVHTELPAPAAGSALHGQHARFGFLDEFLAASNMDQEQKEKTSEILYFRQGITSNGYYGRPRWLAATPSIELVQCATQHEFNFYFNRGVPEFALIATGAKINDDEWAEIQDQLLQHVGLQNSHQSIALNISDENVNVDIVKLAMDAEQDERYVTDMNALAHVIVTAHGVPPIVGGVALPGKAGAANETMNSLMLLQKVTLKPHQRLLSKALARTLGNPRCNGGLDLSPQDFLGGTADPMTGQTQEKGNAFLTILEDIDAFKVNAMSRMQDEAASPEGQRRDLGQGLAERGRDRTDAIAG